MTDYGRDVWCDASINAGRYATGLRLIAQNAVHRLSTPRGVLRGDEDEANYGLDLPGMIGSIVSPGQAAALPGQIQNELLKDTRIHSVDATVTSAVAGPAVTWTIAIRITAAEGEFVLAADDVTVALVGLGGET